METYARVPLSAVISVCLLLAAGAPSFGGTDAPQSVREFDAWVTAVEPGAGSFTLHHNATQYTVVLKTDERTAFSRVRQAPFADFPSNTLMRFWGGIDLAKSTVKVAGVRRAPGDDTLNPEVIAKNNYVGGRLVREAAGTFVEVGAVRLAVEVDPCEFEGAFEEPGSIADLQPGRFVHVRYEETEAGGRALSVIVTVPLARPVREPAPASGATPEQVRQTFAEIGALHERIAPELARLMPVTMTVTPGLAKVGEEVLLRMEALAASAPNPTLELHSDFLVAGIKEGEPVTLPWKATGERHGLTVFQAECRLPAAKPGSYLVHWNCNIGGDIPEFWRYFAVIDDTYAVCTFLSTSHESPKPGPDLHRLHLPYEEWISDPLVANNVLQGKPDVWAAWSREARQYGMRPNPHLYGPYWMREPAATPNANLQAEPPELQKAILAGYREMLPWLGFGAADAITAYTMDNAFCQSANEVGFRTLSSLCPGQNFMDGPMRINHFGVPERPYFVSAEDFRKPGGGPEHLVGISQCQRHTFLNREFNCTYVLEPAWNDFWNEGGGRETVDDLWNSRMYDFFESMLQNRLSQKTPYFFSVGLEFNGRVPGITEGNRMLIEYAARKARTEPLAFATGPAVSDYYRRHFAETPETTCYQPDYFGGLTKLDKFPGYPDTLEIEGPAFQSLLRAPEILPAYHYDYLARWDYPAWGNEELPRNTWGYLYPGQHDPFKVVPRIVDTRRFEVTRADAVKGDTLAVTLTVRAQAPQKNLVMALWDIPREWRPQGDWWTVTGRTPARFVPVRAPFTGNLNGLLVADIEPGESQFTVTIATPPRKPVTMTTKLADGRIEGRVFERDGQRIAYLWPTHPWAEELVVNLPNDRQADAYIAPAGKQQPLKPGENHFEIPANRWMRLVGLGADEIIAMNGVRSSQ